MKKRILASLVLLSFFATNIVAFASSNIDRQIKESKKVKKYSSVQKHTATYEENFYKNKQTAIKDPMLIKFKADELEKISEQAWQQKINSDTLFYSKKIIPILKAKDSKYYKHITSVDFYNLYRIAEKIIRANNLDYINWRLVFNADTANFNAASTEANLIIINSALYDSFHNNDDALAFVIGHEIAHQVLGHMQQTYDSRRRTEITNNVLLFTTFGYGNLIYAPIRKRVEAKNERAQEYVADTLGAEFAIRAGYDYNNIMSALNFMASLPHVETTVDTHPSAEKRIRNLEDAQKYFPVQWKVEGKYNLYNSKPLDCKPSSDRISIVLSAREDNRDRYYKPEATEEILKRVGYIDYKNGNMKNAVKYIGQWAEISNSYVPHLYLSYCYENLYKETNDDKFLKKSLEEAKRAKLIAGPNEKNVQKQINDLKDYIDL